jgi:hypothetical protein
MRYGRADYTNSSSGFTVGDVDLQSGPRWIDLASIGWNHMFNSATDLAVTVGGTNFRQACCYYPGYDQYKPSSIGLPSYLDAYAGKRAELPVLQVNNYQQIGQVDNSTGYFRTLAFRGNLTHVRGRHTIDLGAEYRLQHSSQGVQGNLSGTYTYDNTYTQQNNGSDPTYSQSNTGLSYAAFLLGIPTQSFVSSQPAFAISSPYAGLFVGDTWRVTPKLTIIPGIRYEWEAGVTENTNSMIVGWNPNASLPIAAAANPAYQSARASATPQQQAVLPASLTIQGGPIYAGVSGASKQQWDGSNRVLPRIAAAYQLSHNTVLRGGYGMFSDTLNALNPSIDQDGFSASTSAVSSTTFGRNFSNGVSPLANPFPSGFNAPIGNAAGAMYYAGGNPNIYDHSRKPARAQRGEFSVQRQFGSSTLVEARYIINYTSDITQSKNYTPMPASFFAGGQQPNNAPNALLSSQITNPFNIANFASLATTDPAAYNLMVTNGFFTAQKINISDLVRAYPQMNGLTLNQSIGQSHFQELQLNLVERYSHGLTLMAALQINDQHDRDYFANPFDPSPSWEPSNYSTPERLSLEAVYDLPFGRGRKWAESGWESALFGGFQVSMSYEAQQGALVNFGNLFYVGNTDQIKIKHPIYVDGQATGGSNYVKWLNPGNVVATPTVAPDGSVTCTYTGTGFVTNSQCQPTGFNLRAFPSRVNGVRQMGWNDANLNVQREFRLAETVKLQTRIEAYNVFNHQVINGPNTSPTDPNFGRVNGDGWPGSNGRWIMIQGAIRF